jgi:NTP pyrophosphatase (non-canonical NTP hydrolase)
MTTTEFEQHVADNVQGDLDLNYAVIAINGEAGEVAEWYKKAVLRGNVVGLTDRDLQEELGDVLYYLTRIAQLKGWTLSEVMDVNKVKLDGRKQKGFKQIV